MFYSTYIPVNLRRQNASVQSEECSYPLPQLLVAYELLAHKAQTGDAYVEEGSVRFLSDPSIAWPIPNIYRAYNAYTVGMKNNFSFYSINDSDGIPQMFVSKMFKCKRLVVNALTFQTLIINNERHKQRLASMLDHKYPRSYCQALFSTLLRMESGKTNYVTGVIVGRNTEDEFLAVNPLIDPYNNAYRIYGIEWITAMREIVANHDAEVPNVRYENGKMYYQSGGTEEMFTEEHVLNILDIYDKMLKKNSNYVEICNDGDYSASFYYSTNSQYLVDARTFECHLVKNNFVKSVLNNCAAKVTIPVSDVLLIWLLCRTE